jgi:hypothetical protein
VHVLDSKEKLYFFAKLFFATAAAATEIHKDSIKLNIYSIAEILPISHK